MVAGVARTRVFTATWPAYAQVERRLEEHQPGPFCQVRMPTICMLCDRVTAHQHHRDIICLTVE